MWNILRLVKKGDYVYAVVPDHPNATKNGYVLEHRIVMENNLGRLLLPDEIVHHRDEDKKNNLLSNLKVLSTAEHTAHHHATGRSVIDLVCAECGIHFPRHANQRGELKGYKNSFCSRSCSGQFQSKQHHAPVSPRASNAVKG